MRVPSRVDVLSRIVVELVVFSTPGQTLQFWLVSGIFLRQACLSKSKRMMYVKKGAAFHNNMTFYDIRFCM